MPCSASSYMEVVTPSTIFCQTDESYERLAIAVLYARSRSYRWQSHMSKKIVDRVLYCASIGTIRYCFSANTSSDFLIPTQLFCYSRASLEPKKKGAVIM